MCGFSRKQNNFKIGKVNTKTSIDVILEKKFKYIHI